MKVACHCGAVQFEISEEPEWVLDCNCTICRRYGALWSYYRGADQAKLIRKPAPGSTQTYEWGDHDIATHRCRTCGCVMHMELVATHEILGVNMRMVSGGLDPKRVQLRQVDNGQTGFFWTHTDQPVIASRHPPMQPHEWR
jgi:hypothetical protein